LFILTNKSFGFIRVYLFNWDQSWCPDVEATSAILQPFNKALVQ